MPVTCVSIILLCRGYLPPEFIKRQIISKEYDIYSLGMLIIDIMVGLEGKSILLDMQQHECFQHVRNITS